MLLISVFSHEAMNDKSRHDTRGSLQLRTARIASLVFFVTSSLFAMRLLLSIHNSSMAFSTKK